MMQYKAVFKLFQKIHLIYASQIHDIINYSTFIYPFESERVESKEKNDKRWNISKMKRAFKIKSKKYFP